MVEEIIQQIEQYYKNIKICRETIANAKKDKALKRIQAWDDAEGIAKQKEDYVKSQVADLQRIIDVGESEVEYNYNIINTLIYKMEYLTDE